MRNLLSAGFFRLRRCKMLWISCAILFLTETFAILTRYHDRITLDIVNYIDSGFFYYAVFIGLLLAVVCALFLGTEYSDGTIRNKVTAGCRRRDIYLANLILCAAAALIMCVAALVPGLGLGLPLLGGFHMGAARAALSVLGTFTLALAFAAIFTLLAMLTTNRAVSAVAAILLFLGLLAVGVYADSRLQAEPTIDSFFITTTDELGAIQDTVAQKQPNPLYLPDGPIRDAFELIHDCTPGGQAMQYVSLSARRPDVLILCNGAIILFTTAAGLFLFRRKDIK